ncbi:MAG: DNA mismatch repair endonuclease MutL [Kiritimatiellia bacterium]
MAKDGHIRLLPAHVANKVAAGEVVERPASVVKEMVENALDAGATRIDIVITAGGRRLIEVRDNGSGMNRADALMSIERQATSKIRDVDDIEKIATLGFRGEAVPSIASVSRFRMRTRTAESDVGTEITILGGTLQDVSDAGVPVGTAVEVRDLFFNVPARRKFLRAYQTEQAHIKNVFMLNALAHPEVGFTLTCDGREQYNLPPGADLNERIRELFGSDYLERMRPVEGGMGGVHVYGFAGLPDAGLRERRDQFVFVNRRPAAAAVIAYAIRKAYALKDGETRPALILFIDMDPGRVDVNVHPAKREVRFKKGAEVREALILTLRDAILKKSASSDCVSAKTSDAGVFGNSGLRPLSMRSLETEAPITEESPPTGRSLSGGNYHGIPPPKPPPFTPAAPEQQKKLLDTVPGESPWKWCRVIGELRGRYIMLETDGGFVTVDPVAGMERILYEKLLDYDGKHQAISQPLLIPETVRMSPADAERLRNNLSIIEGMGFKVADFGDDHFMVEALPGVIGATSCRDMLQTIVGDITHAGRQRGSVRWKEELVARAVSRAGASDGFRFSTEEAEKLVNKLALCRMPYTCPQGRPTMIFTSYRELDRKFGRK